MTARPFQVWEYTVSHAQLLLRSVRDEVHSTRVDVLFKNVGYLALPTSMIIEGIEELSGDEEVAAVGAVVEAAVRQGRKAFRLRASAGDGLVVAGVMVSVEDERESNEPSALPCWPMRSGPVH